MNSSLMTHSTALLVSKYCITFSIACINFYKSELFIFFSLNSGIQKFTRPQLIRLNRVDPLRGKTLLVIVYEE